MLIEHLTARIFRFDGILIDFNNPDEEARAITICRGSRKLQTPTYRPYTDLVTKTQAEFFEDYPDNTIINKKCQYIFNFFPEKETSVYMVFQHNSKRYIEKGSFISLKHSFETNEKTDAWSDMLIPGVDESLMRKRSYFHTQTTVGSSYVRTLNKIDFLKTTDDYITLQVEFFEHVMELHRTYREEGLVAHQRKWSNHGEVGAFIAVQRDTLSTYIEVALPVLYAVLKEYEFRNTTLTLEKLLTKLPKYTDGERTFSIDEWYYQVVKVGCRDNNNAVKGYLECRNFLDALHYMFKVHTILHFGFTIMLDESCEAYNWSKRLRGVCNDMIESEKNFTSTYMDPSGAIVVESRTRYKVIELRNIVDKLDAMIKKAPITSELFTIDEFYNEVFSEFELKAKMNPDAYKITNTSHLIHDIGNRCVVYTYRIKEIIDECDDISTMEWIKYADNLIKCAATTVFLYSDGNMRASEVRTLKIGGTNKNIFMNPYMMCIKDNYSKSNKDFGRGKEILNILIDGAAFKAAYCLVVGKAIQMHIFNRDRASSPEHMVHHIDLDNVNATEANHDKKFDHLRDYAFSLYKGKLVDMGDCLKRLQKNIVDAQRVTPSTFRQLKAFVQKMIISTNLDDDPYNRSNQVMWEEMIARKNGHSRETFVTEYGTNGIDPKRFGYTQMSHYLALGIALYLGSHFIDDYWSHTCEREPFTNIQLMRDDVIKRNAHFINFSSIDHYMINLLYHNDNKKMDDVIDVSLADVMKNVKCRYPEMLVMVNAMFSSIKKNELLYFECSTGSGKTFTTIEYIKYLADNSAFTSFVYVVPYSSLQTEVTAKMTERGLRVGDADAIHEKRHVDVYVLKFSDLSISTIKSLQHLNNSWFTKIAHIFFDESHTLLTDSDYRDATQGFPGLMKASGCYSLIMLSATLGSKAKAISRWMGYQAPKFYNHKYEEYFPGDFQLNISIPKNLVTNGPSTYYKLVDRSILRLIPMGRVNIPGPASMVKTVLSFININLKGLVFMSSKSEVLSMASILSSIFGYSKVGIIIGTSSTEYLDVCLTDPEIKILVGTTSCCTGLNLGVHYVIIADVAPALCNIYLTYQVVGRIREEVMCDESFLVEIVTKRNENKSVLKILERNFHGLMNYQFPRRVKEFPFYVTHLESIALHSAADYRKKTDWYSKNGLHRTTDVDESLFTSAFYAMYSNAAYEHLVFDGTLIEFPHQDEEEDELYDEVTVDEAFATAVNIYDPRVFKKTKLKDIKRSSLSINTGSWFVMTGYITGKDHITGLYGFTDGTKPDPALRLFDSLGSITDSAIVDFTDVQRRGGGRLRSIAGIPIPRNISVCLQVETSDFGTHAVCFAYRNIRPVTIVGKLQLAEDDDIVFTNVAAYNVGEPTFVLDLSADTFALEEVDGETLTTISQIRHRGSYMVKGILIEVKKKSSFLFFDGTVRSLGIGEDVWDLSGFAKQYYNSQLLNNYYCITVSKEDIHFEDINIGLEDYEVGHRMAVVMKITINKRFGSLYVTEANIKSMYDI